MLTKNEEDAGSCHENEPNLEYLTCQLCSLSCFAAVIFQDPYGKKKRKRRRQDTDRDTG